MDAPATQKIAAIAFVGGCDFGRKLFEEEKIFLSPPSHDQIHFPSPLRFLTPAALFPDFSPSSWFSHFLLKYSHTPFFLRQTDSWLTFQKFFGIILSEIWEIYPQFILFLEAIKVSIKLDYTLQTPEERK